MERIIRDLEAHDPFIIAKDLGIHILEQDLGEIYGYYCKIHNSKFIFLNDNLTNLERVFTCAHELGHVILHPEEMTPKLSKITMTSNLKIEREANEFATNLLIDGRHEKYHFGNKYQLLDFYGIPHEMERFLK